MLIASLVLIGFTVGLIGSLVGAGGGFLVVPILVLLFKVPPLLAAGTSLVMVTVNALAGSIAHIRRGKVDYRTALLLSACSYPGVLLGGWLGKRIAADQFIQIFGFLLLTLAAYMAIRMLRPGAATELAASAAPDQLKGQYEIERRIRMQDGTFGRVLYSVPVAAVVSLFIGMTGALLGIGGGPLIVPFMIFVLHFPPHVAAATSQLNIALTSFGAAILYAWTGNLLLDYAAALSAGALVGSPLGAWLSTRIRADGLVWLMSGILLLIGIRLVL